MSKILQKAKAAPYGTWESPIKAKIISEQSVSKDDVVVDPISSVLYHIETRPEEGGRNVIVESEGGSDLFGRDWNARARVQEYGGAPAVIYDGTLIFTNFDDGQIYVDDLKSRDGPRKITSNPAHRFADFAVHPRNPHLVICILEDHTHDSPSEIVNSLVAIDTRVNASRHVTLLVSGADFYSNPRFNEEGTVLAWCQWNHPDMPWDGCQVFMAGIQMAEDQVALSTQKLPMIRLAGEPGRICAVQPTWMDNHTLVLSCDISGYHNPWVARLHPSLNGRDLSVSTSPLFPDSIDQDFTDPSWWLGTSNIAVLDHRTLLISGSKDGRHQLYIVDSNGTVKDIECPYVQIARMRRLGNRRVAFLGTKNDEAKALITCSFDNTFKPTYSLVKSRDRSDEPSAIDFSPLISRPQPMTLTIYPSSANSDALKRLVHVLFFPPHNPGYVGLANEKPCAIVNVHGGPTSIESQGLNMGKQFFTSRGWAWIDVNYAGSSNYGRKYIEQLRGNWGVTDVEDCAFAVKVLASPEYALIDSSRAVIRGGSAGGFTTLCSLCQLDPRLQVFAAGTSSYGISDLRKLTEITHKFQSWYVQRLLGGTYDEKPEVYQARSAVLHAQNIQVPLLILQGSLDPIVPRSQAEAMVKAIKEKGGEVEYTVFEGEAHGWRNAKTIESALEKEAMFYSKIFGFAMA